MFPGAVPRTFLGAVLLAGLGQPIIALVGFEHAQLVVRGLLGAANVAALLTFKNLLKKAYGQGVSAWWVVFMASQFHINYYLSRTLPNMYAFGLSKSCISPNSQGLQLTRTSNSRFGISATTGLD
jgi:alpha-1,6-mannosyltransferase